MSITIYSVVPKRLIEDAKRIEKHAEDQLEAWIALGQSDKYAKAVDQARILRLAANGKDVYSRRAFLKIAGFTVKNLDKTPKENPTMKPASPAQLAARKRFAEMARSGAFKKKATKRKTNPLPPVVETILEQMGGNKFMVMTGARPVVHGPHMLTFKLPTNQSKANYLDVIHNPGKDLYTMTFRRVSNRGMDSKNLVEYDDVYADQLQPMFEKVTGMYTTMGTMGRKSNPTMRPIIKAATNIRELAYDLENISQDDKKQISDYTDAEILHEAKYVLEIYHESGTVSNDALMGEHGKDEQKSARDDVRKLKALIKKFGATTQRKTNPAKKTVSQKVSQLVHEGYPQRQAVAVALSEQRAGKVKRNPIKKMKIERTETPDRPEGIIVTKAGALKFAKKNMQSDLKKAGFVPSIFEGARGWVINYGKTVKRNPAKVKYRNLATDLKGDQRVGYSVHLASQPGHNAIAWFSKKADALAVAQEAADRTGKPLAVTRVQNYFGAM